MENYQIAAWSGQLDSWMNHNIADEREPTVNGVQLGTALSELTRASEPKTARDLALLGYAAEVLDAYAGHVHAVAYVPTPQRVASDAAAELRKKQITPPSAEAAEAMVVDRLIAPPVRPTRK